MSSVDLISCWVVLAFCLLLFYLIWILHKVIAWYMYPPTNRVHSDSMLPRVSVIIPVRNEAGNIITVLQDLSIQDFPDDKMEILVVDDHSEDDTGKIVAEFCAQCRKEIKWIPSTHDQPHGKKAVLSKAIGLSKFEIILTTDADCRMNAGWVRSMASVFSNTDTNMVTGFVVTGDHGSILSRMEQLDQVVLSAVGATSIITGSPLLCSGANIAFRKKAFDEVGGYTYGANDPSGDDTYLMLRLSASVRFNKDTESIVSTQSHGNLNELVRQRIRWASKVKNYREKHILFFGMFIFFLNLVPLVNLALFIGGTVSLATLLVWLFVKLATDFYFVQSFIGFSNQKRVLWMVPIYFMIYPFYTAVASLLIPFKGYEWKGRFYPM